MLRRTTQTGLAVVAIMLCLSVSVEAQQRTGKGARARAGAGSAATATAARSPRYDDYPVREIYKGRIAPVVLDSKRARMFRSRLREDSRTGPNFAGHYTVVYWGCGTGCAQMAVVDAKTGRVYWPPLEYMDIPPDTEQDGLHGRGFRLDSKLLVLTRYQYDMQRTFTAYYYLFENNRFRLIRKAEEHYQEQPEP